MNDLEVFSILHDIGKIAIDDRVLNKPDKLNEGEWKEMTRHPEIGYRIAQAAPEIRHIADFILTHHERWDGTGYPQKLKGSEIPLLSRILSVIDAYDAMTQNRPYRKALSLEEAKKELQLNAGSQFDARIVEIFLEQVL